MAGRFLSLVKVFRGEKKKGPGAAPAQQPEETEQIQTLQDALDRTQEQEPARGRFRKSLKMFRQFLCIRLRKTGSTAAAGIAEPDSGLTGLQAEPDGSPDSAERSEDFETSETETWAKALLMSMTEDVAITNTKTRETQGLTNTDTMPAPTMIHAPTMDFFEESAVPSHQQQQVPAKVKNIHQSLMSHVSVDARLQMDIVRLAEEHPADVVLTLLRCAPTCDRAAAMMWRAIGSSGPALEKALPTLLCVMEDWPLHTMCTSNGDNKDLFALAATLVIWVIVPECNKAMIPYSGQLFVALLFHVVISTQLMPPEEVDNFWRACREEHRLPSKPNRFAVQAMKALLCRLRCDNEVMAMERKGGWKMLLCARTQHYAMGLLAREMRRIFIPLCSLIALHLLKWLRREEPCWDLPFLAFLVEVLECLDTTKCGESMLEIMSRHLQSKCRERRRLALRGLVVLSKDPSMARRMCSLSQNLVELLGDAHGYVVSMSLSVLTNILENEHILISSTTAPKLAEALLPLFDRDNIHMQLVSLNLFFKVMDLVVNKGKKPLKRIVRQSLLPLFFHCHDENQRVAKASRELLLCAARFLKRRKLKRLLEREKMFKFGKCLLAEDRSRAAEHLRRALPYLQSPQEPLREAAVRFMGSARVLLRGQQEELQVLNEAIQAQRKGTTSHWSRNIHAQFTSRAEELSSSSGSSESES
ncbi:maestro heat-like repeat-containing protein family member 6 isoform X2 [Vidua macroura]|uniref:maestro heat-like repeat-containing protein family member 6 isoform X2 n=1 Tax=Vidua macroura TaxID=187451 RepID=UPI0023A80EA1|nr:maestro heat-like repeat-containing protein family member 6 isoform X2 [Vidua macroura]